MTITARRRDTPPPPSGVTTSGSRDEGPSRPGQSLVTTTPARGPEEAGLLPEAERLLEQAARLLVGHVQHAAVATALERALYREALRQTRSVAGASRLLGVRYQSIYARLSPTERRALLGYPVPSAEPEALDRPRVLDAIARTGSLARAARYLDVEPAELRAYLPRQDPELVALLAAARASAAEGARVVAYVVSCDVEVRARRAVNAAGATFVDYEGAPLRAEPGLPPNTVRPVVQPARSVAAPASASTVLKAK